MAPTRPPAEHFRRRVVGLYALAVMDREGQTHGYRISELIAERTEGQWRPGPGAVYPSLRKLEAGGLARSAVRERRRVYRLTPAGRDLLERIRRGGPQFGSRGPDIGLLWAEVMGVDGPEDLLRLRLRHVLESIERNLRQDGTAARSESLRRSVIQQLEESLHRVQAVRGRPAPGRRR